MQNDHPMTSDGKPNVYIAGPMTSVGGNFNIPLFNHVANRLRSTGQCHVFNPAEYAIEQVGSLEALHKIDKADMARLRLEFLKVEINWIMEKADYVLMLPGWERSKGATAERAVALAFGIRVHNVPTIVIYDSPLDTWTIKSLTEIENRI